MNDVIERGAGEALGLREGGRGPFYQIWKMAIYKAGGWGGGGPHVACRL